jgi:2-succinyl-6-hydroxy-2,4-cyclohexadiene-1-carboxylate synthase
MIHFFPGLFGDEHIWEPYFNLGNFIVHQLDQLPAKINDDDILIGYSMGGRLALKIASKQKFKIKKLILLSAHPGLEDSKERAKRVIWENDIIQKMNSMNKDDFLSYWNSLELFGHSEIKDTLTQDSFNKHKNYFQSNRLSKQKNFLPEMILYKKKILYLFGCFDQKYSSLAKRLRDQSIRCLEITGDHRIYLNHEQLLPILQKEVSL